MNTVSAKTAIRDAAIDLFLQEGYDGTSVREICKQADVSNNMVHHYFGSKQGLYDEIIASFSADVFMKPLELLHRTPANQDELTQLMEIFFEQTLDALIINRKQYILARRAKVKSSSMSTYQSGFVDFIERAKECGLVRGQVDPGMLTGLIIGRLTSQVVDSEWINKVTGTDVTTDPVYKRRWLKANVDIFFNGILKK